MKQPTIASCLLAGLLCLPTHAVTDTADSLYQLLKNDNRANYELANSLMITLDAEGTTDSLYTFSRSDKRSDILVTVSQYMAFHYDAAYSYSKAASAFMEMAYQAHENSDLATEGDALSQAAVEFHRLGQFDQAIKVNLKALHIDSLLNDTALLSNDFSTLAASCLTANRIDDAVRYILMAIEKEESRTTPTKLAIRYGHAAEIFNRKGETDKALQYAEKAYQIDRQAGNETGTARRMSQMADIFMARGEHQQAETYYLRAVGVLEKLQERHSLTIDYKQLGHLYIDMKQPRKAIGWLLKADSLAQMTGNRYFRSQIVRLLASAYEATGQHDRAYSCLHTGMTLNDSIYNERLASLTASLSAGYDLEEQRKDAERQRSIAGVQQNVILLLLLIMAAMAVLLVVGYRKLKKATTDGQVKEERPAAATEETARKPTDQMLKNMPAADRQFLLDVVDYVHNNMKVRKITIDQIAEEMCMSRSQFTRRITALTQETPNAFITRIRMEKAIRMLKDTNMSVKEIAYDCGFDESNYFIRVFRQLYDMTPQQYRNTPM